MVEITVWQVEYRETIFDVWQLMIFRFRNRQEAEEQAERWASQYGYQARIVERRVTA